MTTTLDPNCYIDLVVRTVRPVYRAILCVEIAVCFGAAVVVLAMGVVMLPIWVSSAGVELLARLGVVAVLDSGPGSWVGALPIVAVATGAIGFAGIARVIHFVLGLSDALRSPYRTLGMISAGGIGLCLYIGFVQPTNPLAEPLEFAALCVLPVMCTLHLLYLARHRLFRRFQR